MGEKYVEGNIEELVRENEELMMHTEELMKKLRNTDNSGRYVRPRTHNMHAHTLHSHPNRPRLRVAKAHMSGQAGSVPHMTTTYRNQ